MDILFQESINQYLSLGGMALLITAIVNILKAMGKVQDGQAPTVSFVLNLVGFVAFSLLGVIKPTTDWAAVDGTMIMIANVMVELTKLALTVFASKFWHDNVLRTVPVLGFSFSNRKAKAVNTKRAK